MNSASRTLLTLVGGTIALLMFVYAALILAPGAGAASEGVSTGGYTIYSILPYLLGILALGGVTMILKGKR